MLGKIEGGRRRGRQRMRWLDGITNSMDMSWSLLQLMSIELDGITNSMDMSWSKLQETLGDGEGQGSLACCSPWGCKESDMTERLNNNKAQQAGPGTERMSVLIC